MVHFYSSISRFFSGQFCLLFIIYPFISNESKLVISWKFVLKGASRHDYTDDGGHQEFLTIMVDIEKPINQKGEENEGSNYQVVCRMFCIL